MVEKKEGRVNKIERELATEKKQRRGQFKAIESINDNMRKNWK